MCTKLTGLIAACLAGWLMLALPVVAETPAHPLAGKIFDTRTGALTRLTNPALIPKLFPCGAITLLGEVHDNPTHHAMRARLIRSLQLSTDKRCGARAFVFEHISADQQAGLDRYQKVRQHSHSLTSLDQFFRLLDWDKSGWPASSSYAPLFDQVMRAKGPILAGNPARDLTRRVAKAGSDAVDASVALQLGLDRPLQAALADDLLGELEASHCGLMPKSAFANMAVAQRFRDANMADVALAAAQTSGGVVIFAGNGHVRADRGIPYYIKSRAPDRKIVAVAFVETEDGKTDPATYGPRDPATKPATDYVAFALPAKREDPCEQMRKQMKK